MNSSFLYLLTAFIWGSTWLAIKYQLGVVDPMVSVAYRFSLSAVILLIYCRVMGLNLRFSKRQHMWLIVQGLLLFGLNYWLVYWTEQYLTSGLVSIIFSTIVFLNVINGAIFLKSPIRRSVILGGGIGCLGILLIFKDELFDFSFSSTLSLALCFGLLSALLASLGNIVSAYNQRLEIPVFQINAFGMLYGSLSMFAVALILGKSFTFDFSFHYITSLLYLSIFGSIIAFGAFITLIGRIGADKAGYVTLVFPIIALGLSTVFEDFQWKLPGLLGVGLVFVGNLMIIQKKRRSEELGTVQH